MLYIYATLNKLQARSHGRQHTGSVRVKCTPSEKKSVIERFIDHNSFYEEYKDELYYEHNDKIGLDSRAYTTATIIKQINDKIPDWMQKKNDLYESYLIRHNHIVVATSQRINQLHSARIADEYIDRYYIDYGQGSAPRYQKVYRNSLFDFGDE
jgi:hypothetical protein